MIRMYILKNVNNMKNERELLGGLFLQLNWTVIYISTNNYFMLSWKV